MRPACSSARTTVISSTYRNPEDRRSLFCRRRQLRRLCRRLRLHPRRYDGEAADRLRGLLDDHVYVPRSTGRHQSRAARPVRQIAALAFTLAATANCTLWTSYGALVIHDAFVWGPNGIGLGFSFVQLGLTHAWVGRAKGYRRRSRSRRGRGPNG